MVETLAKWMATSEKWLKNKNGMGVTVKKFTKKEGIYFFELDVPEKYSRFTEKLQSLLREICEQGERYMVSSISLTYVSEEDRKSHLQDIVTMYQQKRLDLLTTLIKDGVEPFTVRCGEELGILRVEYLKQHLKYEEKIWKLPDGSVSDDGIIWRDKNGVIYYNYYNEIAVSDYQAAV